MIDGVSFLITKWYDESHLQEDHGGRRVIAGTLVFMEKVAKFSLGDFTDMFAYHGLQIRGSIWGLPIRALFGNRPRDHDHQKKIR